MGGNGLGYPPQKVYNIDYKLIFNKNMYKKIIIFVLLFGMFSCDEYLDIVPDQTQQIDLLFERRR